MSMYTRNIDKLDRQLGPSYVIGRVKHIVLGRYTHVGAPDPEYNSPRDIGKILFEPMYSGIDISNSVSTSTPAYPMFSAVRQYPLEHEIVLIVPGPNPDLNDRINAQGFYYFPPYSIWNSVQHNAMPNMLEWADYIKLNGRVGNARDIIAMPLGKTFEEKRDIRKLRPFEGDIIIESRFGSSIRFGSTVVGTTETTLNGWSDSGRNGDPITIIRNGQGVQGSNDYFDTAVEDLNVDDSCIYLTSGQNIFFKDLDKFPFGSYLTINQLSQTVTEIDRLRAEKEVVSPAQTDRVVLPQSQFGPNI